MQPWTRHCHDEVKIIIMDVIDVQDSKICSSKVNVRSVRRKFVIVYKFHRSFSRSEFFSKLDSAVRFIRHTS